MRERKRERERELVSLLSSFPPQQKPLTPGWVARRSSISTTSRSVASRSVCVQVARGGRADLKKEEEKEEEEEEKKTGGRRRRKSREKRRDTHTDTDTSREPRERRE